VFAAFATFPLIIAGALVTSNDAGRSVQDWPTSFGHIAQMPRMVGGVKWEHSHRMIAEFKTPLMASSTVAHTAVGALLLASTVVLVTQARRHLSVLDEHAVRTGAQRPVTA
jgi:heme A synthase